MRRATTLLLGVLLAAAGLLVGARPAAACSCAGVPSAAQAFASADAVFSGRLVSREVHRPDWPLISSSDPAVHVFAVDEVFKGVVHEEQGVVSPDSGASCGLELSGQGPFVIYASESGGDLTAGLCDGAAPAIPEVEGELRALAGTTAGAAQPVPRAGSAGTGAPGLPTAVYAAGALVLVLGGTLLLRRRRRAVRAEEGPPAPAP